MIETVELMASELLLATLRHLEDLTHELRLIDSGARSGMVEVPPTLAATIHDIIVRYEVPQQETWRQTLDAERSGCDRLDLRLRLPPNAAEELWRLVELLENADELARASTSWRSASAQFLGKADWDALKGTTLHGQLRRWAHGSGAH